MAQNMLGSPHEQIAKTRSDSGLRNDGRHCSDAVDGGGAVDRAVLTDAQAKQQAEWAKVLRDADRRIARLFEYHRTVQAPQLRAMRDAEHRQSRASVDYLQHDYDKCGSYQNSDWGD